MFHREQMANDRNTDRSIAGADLNFISMLPEEFPFLVYNLLWLLFFQTLFQL